MPRESVENPIVGSCGRDRSRQLVAAVPCRPQAPVNHTDICTLFVPAQTATCPRLVSSLATTKTTQLRSNTFVTLGHSYEGNGKQIIKCGLEDEEVCLMLVIHDDGGVSF